EVSSSVMKPTLLCRIFITFCLALLAPDLASCGDRTPPSGSSKPESKGLVVDGEQFTLRKIIDAQQGGMTVGASYVPEKWRDRSEVIWNYADTSYPVRISATFENPTNDEALFFYSPVLYFWLRPSIGTFRPGQNSGGL